MRAYVVDLTHLLDEDGFPPVDAPKELLKVLSFYGGIIEAGSSHPVRTRFLSTVPCRRRPCARQGVEIANESDGTIRWECPICGESGCISHWQGSNYDLSPVTEPDPTRRVGIHVTAEEHRSLRQILTHSQEEQAIIAGGSVTPEGVWMSGEVEDFEELLGSIAASANHDKNPKRRRLLYVVFDRIERMVLEVQSAMMGA